MEWSTRKQKKIGMVKISKGTIMNYNLVVLGGNITKDIQLSYTSAQTAVASFGIAVNKKHKDKENVCFVDLVAFGKTAETLNKYVKKGDPLFISGELQFETWTASDGTKRSKHKVVVYSFQFLGGKKESKQESKPTDTDDIPF